MNAGKAYESGFRDGVLRCFDLVASKIVPGKLEGNGLDKHAERNGIVLANNLICGLLQDDDSPEPMPAFDATVFGE